MNPDIHNDISDELRAAAEEAEKLYGDIIDLPRPVSRKHAPASRDSRAAQFSPFAALTGYEAAIEETARLTSEKPELSEEQKEQLDRRLQEVLAHPVPVTITFFRLDERKEGGEICRETCMIKQTGTSFLKTDTGLKLALDDILDIT